MKLIKILTGVALAAKVYAEDTVKNNFCGYKGNYLGLSH